jgi:hypothetical protein
VLGEGTQTLSAVERSDIVIRVSVYFRILLSNVDREVQGFFAKGRTEPANEWASLLS